MHDEVHIIEQHPLRLSVTLGMRDSKSKRFQPLVYCVGNGLYLPGIGSTAHHKVIGEGSRIFFQFENGDIFSLFVLAG